MKVMHKKLRQKGFTLLEVLIAIVILTIGLFAMATLQGVAMNANLVSNRLSVGATLAQQVAEEILSRSSADPIFNTSLSNQAYDRLVPNSSDTSISIPGAGTFSAQYSITPNFLMTGTTQINVSVFPSGSPSTPLAQYSTFKMVNN